MMVKYKQYFHEMCSENQATFTAFKALHDLYAKDKVAYQSEFNSQGIAIRKLIEEWDHRLCSHMENGKNATYSARLSEKFWAEVRTLFPLIDFVGVTVRKIS